MSSDQITTLTGLFNTSDISGGVATIGGSLIVVAASIYAVRKIISVVRG